MHCAAHAHRISYHLHNASSCLVMTSREALPSSSVCHISSTWENAADALHIPPHTASSHPWSDKSHLAFAYQINKTGAMLPPCLPRKLTPVWKSFANRAGVQFPAYPGEQSLSSAVPWAAGRPLHSQSHQLKPHYLLLHPMSQWFLLRTSSTPSLPQINSHSCYHSEKRREKEVLIGTAVRFYLSGGGSVSPCSPTDIAAFKGTQRDPV